MSVSSIWWAAMYQDLTIYVKWCWLGTFTVTQYIQSLSQKVHLKTRQKIMTICRVSLIWFLVILFFCFYFNIHYRIFNILIIITEITAIEKHEEGFLDLASCHPEFLSTPSHTGQVFQSRFFLFLIQYFFTDIFLFLTRSLKTILERDLQMIEPKVRDPI